MRLFTTFLMVIVSFTIWAQNKRPNLEIVIGEEIKLKKKELIDKIIGKDEDGTYVMAKYGSEVTLFYYDNDLNQKRKNSFKLEYQKHDLWYKGIVQMKDEFVIFTTYRDKKQKMTYLYSQTLNKEALTFSKPKVLAQVSYEGYKKRQSTSYSFTISADSNYLLFISDLPARKDEKDKFGFIVYDNEMNEVWSEKKIEVEEDEQNFYRYDTQVGNDGKVYLLAKVYDTSRKYKKNEIDYSFKMMVFESDNEGEAEEFDVTLEGEHVTDITFERFDNGNIQVAGFYSIDGYGQNGVFNLLYDSDYTISNESTTEFPTDFIVQHASEKSKKKAKKKEAKGKEIEMYSYSIDELIENEDATITMIAEQYYTYTTSYTDANGNTHTTTHYVYGNIIIVKFDENGDVDWMELIPKRQNSTDGGYYSGYALMQLEDGNLVFVFNDNPKNSYYDQSGKFYTWTPNKKHTDVVLFEISIEGQLGRYILYKGADEEVISRPHVSVPIDANEMIILGQARKATKFVKLVF
jgi:hypothetical protein